MKTKLLLSLVLMMSHSLFAEDYRVNDDFRLDKSLNFHGDANFSDFQALGAQSVLAGMDFDGDGKSEILFSIDETLAPGGPDPGLLGCYLYEADGSGGYTLVWHFITPEPGNSLPGMHYGDIDGDQLHEIYFGVPPASGSNDETWGTYIFEQAADGSFPSQPTLLFRYGMETADNFRPAGFDLADVDGDGKVELCTVDRGGRRLSIDALTGDGLDGFASFTNEFLAGGTTGDLAGVLDGGGIYNLDIADTDADGLHEVWVNTWNGFSMTIFEATGADSYVMASDINAIFPDGDPGSFRRSGFAFNDVDGDQDLDAWFPMTDGKLYFYHNTALDSVGPNALTNGGVESGTEGWGFYPDPASNMDVVGTGETMFNTDSTFTAFEGDSALKIWGLYTGAASENNAFFAYEGDNAIAPGTHFHLSAEFYTNSADDLSQGASKGVLFAKYFGPGYAWIGMQSVDFVGAAPDEWHHKDLHCAVPQGTAIVQVGVMHVQPSNDDHGSFYVDDLQMMPVVTEGVGQIADSDFHEVLRFGLRNRGSDMGDIDGDGKPDIIATTGTHETVVRMEYMGGDPTNEANYAVSTIFESKGEPGDRFYPVDISDSDLDGDGNHEVVLTNLYASNPDQPQIFVLDNDQYGWDSNGGNEQNHLAAGWSIAAISKRADVDEIFASEANNPRAVIGGMDMDQDGKQEVIASDYAGHRVIVYEYDGANSAFDVVWTSPIIETTNHYANPRAQGVGDLDGDGKHEIVFASSQSDAEGWHVYEWDGVVGSDNYGTTFSSIITNEIDTCCAADGPGTDSYGADFRGDHHTVRIADVDGDGQQEFISAIRRGNPRGTLIVSLAAGDDIVHNAGAGYINTWNTEFFVNRSDYGGGSPLDATPADLDGDGHHEIVNHTWNNFHFYNITSTGPDAYSLADPTADGAWYKATANDQYSIWGGYAKDIDHDGNDEVFFSSMGSWGVGSGDVYVVDYDSGDDVLTINQDHVKKIGTNVGQFIGDVGDGGYNGSESQTLFVGGSPPNITAMEYLSGDPSSASSYLEHVVYYGELDVANTTTTTDEAGATTTTYAQKWGFASKVMTHWDNVSLDFDMDGQKELLVSFQGVPDSLSHTSYTWNAGTSQYDTTVTTVANEKPWAFVILENSTAQLGADEPVSFITPDQYRLAQNYPNPFNPNTTIEYTVPINRKVSVKVYNVTGQLVRTLVNNKMVNAGTHKIVWDGKNHLGNKVSTGMYLYSLEWAGAKKVKSMTLVK